MTRSKTELYWAIALMLIGAGMLIPHLYLSNLFPVSPKNGQNWAFIILGACGVLSGLAFAADYFLRPTPLKIYLNFMFDMRKEGQEILRVLNPKWSFWKRFLTYKPPSEQRLIDARVNHFQWRMEMANACDFIFQKPEKGFSASFFFREKQEANWGNQLKRQELDLIDIVLINNPKIYVGFSPDFIERPENVFGFYKSYLKNKRKIK